MIRIFWWQHMRIFCRNFRFICVKRIWCCARYVLIRGIFSLCFIIVITSLIYSKIKFKTLNNFVGIRNDASDSYSSTWNVVASAFNCNSTRNCTKFLFRLELHHETGDYCNFISRKKNRVYKSIIRSVSLFSFLPIRGQHVSRWHSSCSCLRARPPAAGERKGRGTK